ncbi:MAG: PAS domain-containing protein [Candidatus Stygibacter frigidus]|nr:PAS domain-containing protein [Candidatus Stygibacter frigidus]
MKRFSLKFRISFWVLVITSLVIITVGVLLVNNYKKNSEEAFKQNGIIKADLMSDNCVIPLAFYLDMSSVEAKLEKFRIYPSIRQCIIYDNNGKAIADYFQSGNIAPYTDKVYQDTLFFTKAHLHIFLPIEHNGIIYGTLFLCEDTSAMYNQVIRFSFITLLVAILLIMLFYFVTMNLQRTVSEPLSKLLEATENVSNARDYSNRLEQGSNDEIGRLYSGFNRIMTHLALEESEKQVIELELSSTIDKLKQSREEIIGLMHSLSNEVEEKNDTLALLEDTWQRFELAIKGSSDGLWDWKDLNADQHWWSPKCYQLLHYSETDLKPNRKSFQKITHPADLNIEEEAMRDHLEHNIPYDIRIRLQQKEGSFRWFRIRGQALWDENHIPVRMSGSLQDIDEQQRLKQQMQTNIAELEIISSLAVKLNESNDTDEICRLLGEELYKLNPECYLVLSLYDPQEKVIRIKSDKGFDRYYDEITRITGLDFSSFKLEVDQALAKEVPEVNRRRLVRLDNGIYDILGRKLSKTVCKIFLRFLGIEEVYHISFGVNENASGGLTLLVPSGNIPQHVDVIETVMNYTSAVIGKIYLNQELTSKSDQLDLAIATAEIGMWKWNIINDHTTFNDLWLAMLGWEMEDLASEENIWESLLHPDDKENALKDLYNYLKNKAEYYKTEFRLKTKSGDWKWVQSQGKIVKWTDDGKPQLMLGSHIDINERKLNEEKLNSLNEELEERVQKRTEELEKIIHELEEFSYSISHDLKAPLRAIGGFAEILREDHAEALNEDAIKLLDVIEANIRMMGQLIEDLLYYVRLSRISLKVSKLDMGLIAWNAYNHLQSGSKKEDIDLTIADLKSASGDAAQIKLLFTHLFENAIKYRHPERKLDIVVGLAEKDGEKYFYVKDNGIGFEMDHAHHIFKIFHRLHSTELYKGTGVGLAIVKRIIDKHGGKVFAESKPDQGTTIYFKF